MIGRTLSHYKVLEEISRGGMGIVYKALDLKLNREVALKVLPPELVSDPDRKRRFVQEAQAAAALKHPNIGVIYEIDEVDGVDFIAMELIEGEKLSDLLDRGRLPAERAITIATEVADGLTKAHSKGIVHRDLKPPKTRASLTALTCLLKNLHATNLRILATNLERALLTHCNRGADGRI